MLHWSVGFFKKKLNNRCSCTGHFYRGKWPFYSGKLAWCVWRDCPEINLPWEIYPWLRQKEERNRPWHLTWWIAGVFRYPSQTEPIRFLHLTPTWNRKKIEFVFRPFWLILPLWAILKKELICQCGRSVCIFVAVCVMMSVAGANKAESTMILMLGTNEILRLNHDIAKSQTRALWDCHLGSSQLLFFVFY